MISASLGGAVKRHLDRAHLGIFARLAQKTRHRSRKRLVGMHQQDASQASRIRERCCASGAAADGRRDDAAGSCSAGSSTTPVPSDRASASCRRFRTRPRARRVPARRRACRDASGPFPWRPPSARSERSGGRAARIQSVASRSSASSSSRSVLALRVTRKNSHDSTHHAGEQQVEVVRDHVFERDEASVLPCHAHEARDARAQRHLDARHQRCRSRPGRAP